ncbi:MAG: RNA polymerase sigma factor [Acidobacteriota bacterium]
MANTETVRRESWWVLRAQSGDREALNDLLKAVQEPLYRYILSLARDEHLAEDVLQEVFIRIYRKLRWLREPDVFRSWAYRIATRETLRRLKRERRWDDQVRDEATLQAIPTPPSREELAADRIEHLSQSLAKLSPASRAVVVLYYLHEMSLGEVAGVLEIPLGTVKSRLSYGLRSMRLQLQEEQIGGSDVGKKD